MPTCINHPDRETNFVCMKYNIPMCEECLECKDPSLYCKHRSACPIWFFHKENEREQRQQEPVQ